MFNENKLKQVIALTQKCNKCAMLHFKTFNKNSVNFKTDNSPVTKADLEVSKMAVNGLQKIFPGIKIISEESNKSQKFFKNNKQFWLIDPIDGTKEYINSSPNFTVNFALIENRSPIFGLISQPHSGIIWYTFRGKAWKLEHKQAVSNAKQIVCSTINYDKLRVLSSFNHRSNELDNWISIAKPKSDSHIGSSIKFCYMAEGKVDFYPRTSPTMEWDIAAGLSILKAAGGNIVSEFGLEIQYGKVNFKNKNFLAFGKTKQRIPSKLLLCLNKIDINKYEDDLKTGVKVLKNKNLLVFPTETVYGIGSIGNDKKAIKSIYLAKDRPLNNPLIAHTFSKNEAEKYAQFTENSHVLTNKFWPGPLTIVLQTKISKLSDTLSQGKSSIAIRVPSHPVALDLLEKVTVPVLAPSANKSGGVSPTSAQHSKDDFGPHFKGPGWKLEKILDYGSCEIGIESTVVDCRGENPIILRHGSITSDMILDATKRKVLNVKDNEIILSPGQLNSHYSPNAKVYLNQKINISNSGWLTFGNYPKSLQKNQNVFNLSPEGNLVQACYLLYSGLRYLDSCGVKIIQVMPIPKKGLGIALNDRLTRASYKE